jgi:hypothetical protein
MSRTIEADFLANSCKQGGLNFTENQFFFNWFARNFGFLRPKYCRRGFQFTIKTEPQPESCIPLACISSLPKDLLWHFKQEEQRATRLTTPQMQLPPYLPFMVGSDTLQLPFENSVLSSSISSGAASLTFSPAAP